MRSAASPGMARNSSGGTARRSDMVLRVTAGAGRAGRKLFDGVAEDADVFDFDFDDIAGGEFARATGSAGIDDVAGKERAPAADAADNGGAVESQLGGGLTLDDLAVE